MDFSQEIFKFVSSAHSDETFGVVRFEGSEGLSRLFEFEITLISPEVDIDWDGMMDNPATFTILRGDENVNYHGILKSFDVLGGFQDHALFRAVLVPTLYNLTLLHNNQIFLNQSVPDILTQILKDVGLTSQDYTTRLQGSYDPREYVCQYLESHYDFLARWMEREGLYYFFEHGGSASQMVITDSRLAHSAAPHAETVRYAPPSGLESTHRQDVVNSLVGRRNAVSKTVYMKDYNYRKPSLDITGQADGGEKGRGEVHLFGEHARTSDEGKALAKVRGESLKCREHVFHGSGTASFLRSGYTFTLTDHFRSDFNQKLLVVDTHHQGSQAAFLTAGLRQALADQETGPRYSVDFTAIPADTQFRPEQKTEKPRIYGVLSAKIDTSGSGQYAELDDQGRYKVVMPFDESGRSGGKASHFLRMMQPYAGSDHGMHFPLHKGAEVLLAFIDGNPDRPVITGAVPNPENPSLVNQTNQTQSVIQTGGQNKVVFEDQNGSEGMLLHSPGGKSFMRMGAVLGAEPHSDPEPGFRVNTQDKFVGEIGSDCTWKIVGNELDILLGASEEVTVGAATDLTVGAYTDVVIGQYVEMVLGMYIEAKKGYSVSLGELNNLSICPAQELVGSSTVSLKAGGAAAEVGKALTAALSASVAITAGFAASGGNPSNIATPAVAGTLAGVAAILSAIVYTNLAKTKLPDTYQSTLEMSNTATGIKSPKVEITANVTNVEVTATLGEIKLTAKTAAVSSTGDTSVTSSGGDIKLTATAKDISLTAVAGAISETGKSIALTATDNVSATAPSITLKGATGITLETDNFAWKPITGGILKAGPLTITAATGMVKIG